MIRTPDRSRSTLAKTRNSRSDTNGQLAGRRDPDDDGGGEECEGAYRRLCFNADDFEVLAARRLRPDLYDYLASGSGDAQTLAENRRAYRRWFLRPRVLRPVGRVSTRTVLRFGRRSDDGDDGHCAHTVAMPVFVSPAGVHGLCDPRHGECATARACARASVLFGLSQHATRSIEDVAAAVAGGGALQFYQAYILKDRPRTLALIRRAVRAGYRGIFLTVDSVRFGYREADARNGFDALPPPHRLANYDELPADAAAAAAGASPPGAFAGLERTYNSQENKAWDQNSEQMFEQDVSWDDVTWIKRELARERRSTQGCFVPLVVKGILTAEDAALAVRAGADGLLLSNHGGRQLDGCLAAIDVLPEVARVVDGRIPIWIDGGIRRGTDVLKALGA